VELEGLPFDYDTDADNSPAEILASGLEAWLSTAPTPFALRKIVTD
jgi:hypothetical protein